MDPTTRDSSDQDDRFSEPSNPAHEPPASESEDRRAHRIALAVIFAVPTVFFADLLFFGSQLYFGDLTTFYFPINHILRGILLAGELPSWNPFWSGGQPFAANPEFHVFYPLRWLILIPDFQYGFRLHILIHVYLAIAGAWFFFRDLSVRIPSAAFGALTFGLGGFYLSYLEMPSFYFTMVWIPIILLFGRRFILRPTLFSFAACALAWGLQLLAGEPTTILQTGLLLGCIALHEAWHAPRGRARRALRSLSLVALLSAGAFLVGAIQMLPAADHVKDSVRARGLPWDMIEVWSMPWVRPAELLFPDLLGERDLQWYRNVYPGKSVPYIDSFNLGTIAGLAILGALIHWRRPAGAVSIVAVSAFLLAAGSNTPILRFLYETGVFRTIRYPEKFALTAALALHLLAVVFLDRCLRRDRGALRAMILASVGVATLSAILFVLSFTSIYPSMFEWLWGAPPSFILDAIVRATRNDWAAAALFASITALLFGWLRSHEPGRAWLAIVFLLIAIELGLQSNTLISRIEESFYAPPPLALSLDGDADSSRVFHAADLEEQTLRAPWTLSAEAKSWVHRNGMYPRMPGAWGFHSVLEGDYDMTNLLPTTDLLYALFRVKEVTGSDRFSESIMAMSNVGNVLTYSEDLARRIRATPPELLAIDEVTPVRSEPRNYPRYFMADALVRITDPEDFVTNVAAQDHSGDKRKIAYVELEPFAPGRGTVTVVDESSNAVSLNIGAEAPAFLVISITAHKYWNASLDGSPAVLQRANLGYQGLAVPRGRHRVELRYRNPLIEIGAAFSLFSLLTLSALLFFRRHELRASRV